MLAVSGRNIVKGQQVTPGSTNADPVGIRSGSTYDQRFLSCSASITMMPLGPRT